MPKAPRPRATFPPPVVNASPASPPIKVFETPVETDEPALYPTATLYAVAPAF